MQGDDVEELAAASETSPPLVFGRIERARVIDLTVLALAVLIPVPGLLAVGGTAMEEGLVLVGAERILDGQWPNSDFEHLYGPGNVWTVAIAFGVFGTSIVVERLVGLAFRLLAVWALYRLGSKHHRATGLTVALLGWALIAPFGLIAYAWISAVALALAALAVAAHAEDRPGHWFVSGALVGLSLVFRPDLVLALGLGFGWLAWSSGPLARRGLVRGLFVGLSPYLVHLVLAGPRAAIEGMVVDPVFRLRGGRSLPVPPSWSDSGDFFARVDDLTRGADPWPGLDRPAQLAALFWLVLLAAAVAVWLARRHAAPWLFAYSLVALGSVTQLLQRPSPNHVKFVGLLVFTALAVNLAVALADRVAPAAWLVAPALMAGLVVVAPHHIGRFTWNTFTDQAFSPVDVDLEHQGRVLPVASVAYRDEVGAVLRDLDRWAEPGDRVFVGPQDLARTNYSETSLYHLLPDYLPASYHLEMNPGLANRDGGPLADDLRDADWLLLSSRFDGWSEPNDSVDPGSPEPTMVRDGQFCIVAETGSYQVWGRVDRVPCT